MSKPSLIASLSVGLLALSAWAQDKPAEKPADKPAVPAPGGGETRQKWVMACQADIAKLCAQEAKTGDARPCLASHEKDLTQACADAFIKPYKIVQLCSDDIKTLCGGSTDGRELAKCFNEKKDKLSPKCRSALTRGERDYEKKEAKAESAAKPETAPAATPKKKKASRVTK